MPAANKLVGSKAATDHTRTPSPVHTRVELAQTIALMRSIRAMPPARRKRFLLGMRKYDLRTRRLIAEANREIRRAERRGASMPLIEAVTDHGERPTIKGMTRSRYRTRIGDAEGTVPTRRLLPKPAARLEDRYDGMSTFEATVCADPPSVTGVQLQTLRAYFGDVPAGHWSIRAMNKKDRARKNACSSAKSG